jgi:hypothetical protein
MANVLRILSAVALLAIVAAGCGGAARPEKTASRGVPRALAQEWEGQAAAIAAAATAGDDCRARQLASSLQDEVEQSQHRLPLRLRSPLVTGVTALADRTTCSPVAHPLHKKAPKPETKPPPKPHGHDKGGDKDHGKGHGKGHGG